MFWEKREAVSAARGILFGVLLAALLWLLIAGVVAYLLLGVR